MKKLLLIVVLVGIAFVAYQQNWPPFNQLNLQAKNPNPYLKFVPAETPLFAGNLSIEPMLNFNTAQLGYGNQLPTEGFAPELAFFAHLYNDLLLNAHSTDTLRAHFGLPLEMKQAIYLQGASPVIKTNIENSDAFWSAFDRAEKRSGFKHTKATFEQQEYRQYTLSDEHFFIVSLMGEDATLALISSKTSDTTKSLILGKTLPEKNFADSELLKHINKQYDFKAYPGIFVLDFEKIVSSLFAQENNIWLEMIPGDEVEEGLKKLQQSECKADTLHYASMMPRLLLGFSEYKIEDNTMVADYEFTFELAENISNRLNDIEGYIPNYLTKYDDNLIGIGLGVNIAKIGELIQAFKQSVSQHQTTCEPIVELQQKLASVDPSIVTLSLSTVYGLKGAGIAVIDLTLGENLQKPVENLNAIVSVTSENANNLWYMLSGAVPQLSQISLSEKPTLINIPQLNAISSQYNLPPVYVALKGQHLVLYTGEKAAKRVAKMDKEKPHKNGLLFESVSYSKLGDIVKQVKKQFWPQFTSSMQVSSCLLSESLMDSLTGFNGDIRILSHFEKHGWVNDMEANLISAPSSVMPEISGEYTVHILSDGCQFVKDGQENIKSDGTGTYQRLSEDGKCVVYETEYTWKQSSGLLQTTYLRDRSRQDDKCDNPFDDWVKPEADYTNDECVLTYNDGAFYCTYTGDEPSQFKFVKQVQGAPAPAATE